MALLESIVSVNAVKEQRASPIGSFASIKRFLREVLVGLHSYRD